MQATILTVLISVIQFTSGAWDSCQDTGCNGNGCQHDFGEAFVEKSSSCCLNVIGCVFHKENCCPPPIQGVATYFNDQCRWTGCSGNDCNFNEIEVTRSECPNFKPTGVNTGNNELCCKTRDYSNWLGDLINRYDDAAVTIDQLTVLGTHHSPTNNDGKLELIKGIRSGVTCDDDLGADTQRLSLSDQFRSGVRAFNFRPQCLTNGEMRHYHGVDPPTNCIYDKVENLLKELKTNLDRSKNEIVYVLFENFRDFDSCTSKFMSLVSSTFKNMIIKPSTTKDGWPTIQDLVKNNKRIMILSKDTRFFNGDVVHKWSGLRNIAGINVDTDDFATIGQYSNTDNASDMLRYLNNELKAIEIKQKQFKGRRFPLTNVHFYTTADFGNPPKDQVRSTNSKSYQIRDMIHRVPINFVWFDFVHTHKGHIASISILEKNGDLFSSRSNVDRNESIGTGSTIAVGGVVFAGMAFLTLKKRRSGLREGMEDGDNKSEVTSTNPTFDEKGIL